MLGSGKSTMLKCLTGILQPDEGSVVVDGSISALLELGEGLALEELSDLERRGLIAELQARARALLEQAWEQPAADRLDWLAAHCDDPELRAEVESLLHADREATDFLAGDAGTLAARLLETAGRPAAAVQQRIDRYEIVKRIARGGMGVVYEATDTRLDRNVALKVLPREIAESAPDAARFEDRFTREARAAGLAPGLVSEGRILDLAKAIEERFAGL